MLYTTATNIHLLSLSLSITSHSLSSAWRSPPLNPGCQPLLHTCYIFEQAHLCFLPCCPSCFEGASHTHLQSYLTIFLQTLLKSLLCSEDYTKKLHNSFDCRYAEITSCHADQYCLFVSLLLLHWSVSTCYLLSDTYVVSSLEQGYDSFLSYICIVLTYRVLVYDWTT